MKAYKIELLVLDFDEVGASGIKDIIENTTYPNRCISPDVKAVIEREVGPWSDEHPLNMREQAEAEYRRLFGTPTA